MNGSQVRDTVFCPAHALGYVAEQVDELCRRVAAELDAGGSVRPLIENAAFRTRKLGLRYDIDAVDWFLDQFLLPPVDIGRAALGDDTWDDLPVTQVAQATGEQDAFGTQCDRAWHDFGQLPGTRLWFGNAARGIGELRTSRHSCQCRKARGSSIRGPSSRAGGVSRSGERPRNSHLPRP